jgi:acyl-coenzyme A thioesterase PaaI-like protein
MLVDDAYCFGCGPNNPIGLRLTFEKNEETGDYTTLYHPVREHQGWVGRVHGGLLALVFDEVLSRVALTTLGLNWVTAELTTRMIRPAPIGSPLLFKARIVSQRSRLVVSSADALDTDGQLIAVATAKLMRPRSEAGAD